MQNKTIFQFISEPSDINYGGNVHGGSVMKWIDQAGYACASSWASSYCVTVYVGGIRFYSPIKIGHIVKVEAEVIYTGSTSMHIAIKEQLSIDQPVGILKRFERLLKETGNEHDAMHQVMECLAEMIWQAQRSRSALDASIYFDCLDRRKS